MAAATILDLVTFTFDVNIEFCTAQSNLMSSVVKIDAMVPKNSVFAELKMAVAAILDLIAISHSM